MSLGFNNMEFKSVSKFKGQASDFVFSFDSKMNQKEYIAIPTQNIGNGVTFHKCMKVTILIGQMFGLIPVLGICENDASKLRFTYYSGRCFYTFLSIIGQNVLVFFYLLKIFWEKEATFNNNSVIVFFAGNGLITLLFFKVAKKWPRLVRQISNVEAVDPITDNNLIWKCNITCIVVILLAVVEHGLHDLSATSVILACQPDKNPISAHLMQDYYWIWVYIPYHPLLGVLAMFFDIQCAFNWNYSDTFIMCICWYLIARIQQINDRILSVQGQITVPPTFWRTVREDYTKATSIVRHVDEIISGIVFVSFTSNLYSICFLFLHTLEEGLKPATICDVPSDKTLLGGYEHTTYYLFSISFLLLRSLAMSLLAASVNSTSAETAFALYDVPTDAYNVEVQRLIDQVHGGSVALSGMKFFDVKRGIVLTIAAAIVTYELILIQFTGVNPASS